MVHFHRDDVEEVEVVVVALAMMLTSMLEEVDFGQNYRKHALASAGGFGVLH